MTDHAERGKMSEAEARLKAVRDDVRQSLESYYWPSDTNAGDKDAEAKFASARRSAAIDMKAYESAVLASARERVERITFVDHDVTTCTMCTINAVCWDGIIHASRKSVLDAAARAITEAP